MKKIILLSFTLLIVTSVFSQVLSEVKGEKPIFYGSESSKATVCSQSNPSNAFEAGRGCSANNNWTAANDIIVAADENFMLKKIEANIFGEIASTITSVDVFYYTDNAGVPGAQIGSQLGVVPTSQNFLGNNFGLDVWNVVLDIAPFVFNGQSGIPTTYWIGLSTTNNATTELRNFWETTSVSAVGNALAFDDTTGYIIPDVMQDGVYTFSGICLSVCDYFNPSNAFEGGRGCSPNSGWLAANDLLVNANENFLLQQIIVYIWENSSSTITNVDVSYYDDNAGLPDNQIGFELGLTPTSQTVIGSSIGYDIHEVILDITPFTFNGQVSIPTTYWIGLSVTNSAGTNNYWEYSTNSSVGNMLAFNDNGSGWGIPNASQDGVYIFGGQCQGLGVADAVIEGFSMYPNPVENTLTIKALNNIDAINVYNLLGQEVLRKTPSTTQVQMDMSALLTGAYIVKVQVGNQTASYSLIKQ